MRRRLLLSVVPSVVLALCLYLVDLPLWVESPGGARSVLPLIAIDGAPTYDSEGRLLLTTVNVGRVNLYYALRAWLDPAATVLSERDILPVGLTDREYDRISLSQMDQSKIAAVAVALERSSDYPEEHGRGALVQDTVPGSPADGLLFAGDVITHIDDEPLADLEGLRRAIDGAGAGRPLRFTARPLEGGTERVVTLRPVIDPELERPVVGVYTVANFPFDIQIESGSIGGPSAGLMWTLGVTDLLTPGDLTGDRAIAGTGTVDLAGNVGPIGGITLKVQAAEEADADVFLLPEANLQEARTVESELELVPVVTVEQALSYLEGDA
jgi:PDZ domain-containing protein